MKKILFSFIAVILFSAINAQKISKKTADHLKESIQSFWRETDKDFLPNTIPGKWKDASGVIIAQKTQLIFDKQNLAARLKVKERTRRKIYLKDRDAVTRYSQLYFFVNDGYGEEGFAARVIKPGEKKEELDLINAIKLDNGNEVPNAFRTYIEKANTIIDRFNYNNGTVFYKIAVPNLEPGDIIEYAYMNGNINDMKANDFYEFEPIYYLCNREFPVMTQQFEIKTDNKSYVNAKSINKAPEFKEINDKDWNVYSWEDRDREKVKDTRWLNEYLVLPLVKFQIIFSKDGDRRRLFIGDKGELKKDISINELAKKVDRIYRDMDKNVSFSSSLQSNYLAYATTQLLTEIQKILDDVKADKLSDDEYINKLYYAFRHKYALSYGTINSQFFAYGFIEKLKRKNIPCQLIITTQGNVTKMKDVIFKEELEWLVKVKDKYVFRFNPYTNLYDVKEECQGNEAYIIDMGKNPTATRITLPTTKSEDNKTAIYIECALDAGFANLEVTSISALSGLSRENISSQILAYTDAYRNDYKNYGGNYPLDGMKNKQREEAEKKIAQDKAEEAKRKPEYMKELLQNDFTTVKEYKSFELNDDGRNTAKPVMKYKEQYVLGDLVKKAGKSFIISLPSLIGGQIQIKPEEKDRQNEIDINFPKSLRWQINFSIPAGYTVGGLEDLNTTVENETGLFSVNSKIEKNKLVLDIKKVYKQKNMKKEQWPKMTEWLDAAYNFSQKKIALKKIN
ncbi:MAG TPA: DUF3857 domain-containing protein [Chitinophagaceae bacterium]|nr:DUF3857 domain-containing protein [Chitinophagaceae bacterium]